MVLDESLSNASAANKKYDESSSKISFHDSDDDVPNIPIPEKPKMLTEEEINTLIREQEGFDNENIFKDIEINQEGMARLLGFTKQVEIEDEIEKRRAQCNHRRGQLLYQVNIKVQEYTAFITKNPHLIKQQKLTPQTLKKRKQLTQKGAATKRLKRSESFNSLDDNDDDFEEDQDLDSDYGDGHLKKSRRGNKQMSKKIDAEFAANQKPLDRFGEDNQYNDDSDEMPVQRTKMVHMEEDDEDLQRKKKEEEDRKRHLAKLR